MLLVYTHKISPRVKYIFKHICTHILQIPVSFTNTIETFIAHNDIKISYTKQALSNELFFKSTDILFEQGLSDTEIQVQEWGNTKCFFATKESALPFDIFAASFYLLSRYEEYLPHVKDDLGRFTAEQSLAFKHHFLHQPVVDIWAYNFKRVLQDQFPNFTFKQRSYQVKPVIDIPSAYSFKLKGIMRTIGGSFYDLFKFKFNDLYLRYAVLLGVKKDPFDTYDYILKQQNMFSSKFMVFFLLANYSTFDKNINVYKQKFIALIKQIADYCEVGLKVSYFGILNSNTLKIEKKRLEKITHSNVKASRQSFSKINIPTTYRDLLELEIFEDYTMGYTTALGFRAGTATPFFFYDLDYETQTPLKVYSYHVLDRTLFKYKSMLDKKQALRQIIKQVKAVNGILIPVFHNYSFSEQKQWKGFKELFNTILKSIDE